MTSTMPTLKPRLVHLIKHPGQVSFGFNVTATRSEAFRYIGIVVDNSLAKQGGLRSGDRVCEVNGVCVDGVPLRDVQELVAKGGGQVKVLLADPMTDQLYRDNHETIRDGLPETICVRVGDDPLVNGETQMEAEVVDPETFISTTVIEDEDDIPPPVPPPAVDEHSNGVIVSSHETCPFKARLCTIKKWPDYQGFGFVLHGDKEEPGQCIGKVEPGSPSEAAGLRPGDRLIEVNGENVEGEYQQQVVGKIANGTVPGQVVMLVVDPDAHRFFKGHSMTVHSSMVDVERIETPPRALVPAVGVTGRVRLCHVKKWHDFQGYGFVLHGERGSPGTYLTNIDPGSPAEAAGLKDGDKIIEINGTNVESEEQPQAIARIQNGVDGDPNQTRLLVVDAESERYFKRQNIHISGSMSDVVYMTNPDRTPPVVHSDESSNASVRLCHVKKWHDFQGYGFVLHGESGSPGTYLTNIDPGSPAEAAGLKNGDRIVEINGINVESEEQPQAITRIQTGLDGDPNQTRLLVVDPESDRSYKRRNIHISGSMTDVVYITNPDRTPPVVLSDPLPDREPDLESETISRPASSLCRARLCHLKKWSTFDGYGFYLHSEEDAPGVFIGKIDPDSPAEAAGLRAGDRIIEVNGDNAETDTQNDLVQKVVKVPDETRLLVVDPPTYTYFLNNGVLVNGNMIDIDIIECPDR